MVNEARYEGRWFLPGSEMEVPGTLAFSPAEGIRLSLNGEFPSGHAGHVTPVIFGHTSGGKAVTLSRCLLKNTLHSFPGYGVAQYHVHFVFIGAHLPLGELTPFPAYRVRISNLEEFIGVGGLTMSYIDGIPQVATAKPSVFTATVDGTRVDTRHEIRGNQESVTDIRIQQRAFMEFACHTPLDLVTFDRTILRSVHTMMEVAANIALPLTALVAFQTTRTDWEVMEDGAIATPDEVEILYKQRCSPASLENKPLSHLPFTVASLGGQWEHCLRRWDAARQKFGPTFDHFFSLNRTTDLPIELRLLSLAQALESLHRREFPDDTQEPSDAFKGRKRRLAEAVPREDRRWLLAAVQYSNELRLRDRMKHLWRLMPILIQARLGSEDDFARRITKTRNYLTHYSEASKGHAAQGLALVGLVTQLGVVLRVMFLIQLGLDPDAVLATAWGAQWLLRLDRAEEEVDSHG